MEVKKRLIRIIRQEQGMALLFVLCLFAVLVGLGASIFFASVTSVRTAAEENFAYQEYLSAYSTCEAIKDQIEDHYTTGETELGKMVSGLAVNESLPISGTLPGKMGQVEGSFQRKTENMGVLKITAYREASDGTGPMEDDTGYTMCLVFSRWEASGTTGAYWEFQQYIPAGGEEIQ